MIVIVNGAPGSGKTTFEEFLIRIVGSYCGYMISTIDFVKQLASQCGWDGTKDAKNRKFLSDLKDLLTQWDNVPYNKVKEAINHYSTELECLGLEPKIHGLFLVDSREPEEIEKFKKDLGAITVLVRRSDAEQQSTSNHADANVLEYKYDYEINNNSTLNDLYDEAINFLNAIEYGGDKADIWREHAI